MRYLLFLFVFLASLAQAQEFLDPADAFKASARALDGQTVEIKFTIADGYYLYRDKFRVRPVDERLTVSPPELPRGKEKNDENFGKVEVFYKTVALRVTVDRQNSGEMPLQLDVVAQGCADAGVCYPPHTQTVALTLPDPATTPSAAAQSATASNAVDGDESGQIAGVLRDASLFAILGFFFLAGLGLSLTPCVFPMIPILSGIIAGQGKQVTRGRAFALSVAYVLGMALTYALAGVAAGLSGTLLSAALQNAWVLGGFAAIFVVLSLSMFGFYELQLPTALQSKLSEESGHLQGGRGIGVFLMGALSALIVGPCVAAPLAGALLYIGQTGNAVLGGSALFVMALGMGVPLLLVGLAGATLLPRTGPWMEGVKKAFGVLLLATALWLISPVIPGVVEMLGWAVLCILPAIYLHALDPLPPHAKGWLRFWKGIGVVLLLTGAALLLGALAGGRDPLQPLAGLRGSSAQAAENRPLSFEPVHSLAQLDKRLRTVDRPVMLDFYADWCVSCKEMEKFTFADPAVQAKLAGFTLLKADVTHNTAEDKALLARFGLFGPPGIIFFNAEGQEIAGRRIVGYQNAAKFLTTLDTVQP
ncbi:MAG: protein-disulfide reductase DsbD [Dechloromonas sp.]|nr:protein-disulfide reductase DsbD [Dechloromonas sp.]